MILNFHIHYKTAFGEKVKLLIKNPESEFTLNCQTYDGENWTASLELEKEQNLEYKYALENTDGTFEEWGSWRYTGALKGAGQAFMQDIWRSHSNPGNAYFSTAFKDVIFRRHPSPSTPVAFQAGANRVTFRLHATALEKHQKFCILGNCDALGNWVNPIMMQDTGFPLWETSVDISEADVQIRYKYAIYDEKEEKIVAWEKEDDRICYFNLPDHKGYQLIRTDENFRFPNAPWRGTGVVIPVFSLRSEQGLGIGEFTDLHLLTDWAESCGIKLVQVLPVNDTIAARTWTDSYPYAAISVFALNPLYVNLQSIALLKDKQASKKLHNSIAKLNGADEIDFDSVIRLKFEFFKALYQQEKDQFWKNSEVRSFMTSNEEWLRPYAAFCYLRDLYDTANFALWKKHRVFSAKVLTEICNPSAEHFDEVALHYFIQYHAHRQLWTATQYARSKGIVLKGDLPIGIYRYSCDAWVAPELYNMDEQAGAPPDDFAVSGQNWGFPTYNWEEMAKDNFSWWKKRMSKLSEYFDALRIDHILGFFRIWQIPLEQIDGTLGMFNPRLPYNLQELENFGLRRMVDRCTQPFISDQMLSDSFGENKEWVKKEFLEETGNEVYRLKEHCNTQAKIKALFQNGNKYKDKLFLEHNLSNLVAEVLLLEEPGTEGKEFNPRITLFRTKSFEALDEFNKHAIMKLYNDYYFSRHDEFWKKQALWKLPALLKATNMLICGEDLGMIPNTVPGVMRDLNIISLEIQRMPKGSQTFGDTGGYPYMSVCSPSCHDMSTIRGWWESDYQMAQRFFREVLRQEGSAPKDCSPQIVEMINSLHLNSPSMWAIFPIQDLVGMDETLRRKDAASEQINDPSNPKHCWNYRFHIPLESLNKEKNLALQIKKMIQNAGR